MITLNFEIHPLIKEFDFLRYPTIILDPIGDRLYGNADEGKDSMRGGEPYYKPLGKLIFEFVLCFSYII